MEKFRYLVFSIFLSSIIIYMGVGVPIVQSRCHKCADRKTNEVLVAVIEVSEGGCVCGCTQEVKEDKQADSGCSCRRDKTGESSESPCSGVKIQKLNLPILTAALHLDNVILSVIYLIFNTYNINFDLLSSLKGNCISADTSLHRQPPRGYLNLICTLLI